MFTTHVYHMNWYYLIIQWLFFTRMYWENSAPFTLPFWGLFSARPGAVKSSQAWKRRGRAPFWWRVPFSSFKGVWKGSRMLCGLVFCMYCTGCIFECIYVFIQINTYVHIYIYIYIYTSFFGQGHRNLEPMGCRTTMYSAEFSLVRL